MRITQGCSKVGMRSVGTEIQPLCYGCFCWTKESCPDDQFNQTASVLAPTQLLFKTHELGFLKFEIKHFLSLYTSLKLCCKFCLSFPAVNVFLLPDATESQHYVSQDWFQSYQYPQHKVLESVWKQSIPIFSNIRLSHGNSA